VSVSKPSQTGNLEPFLSHYVIHVCFMLSLLGLCAILQWNILIHLDLSTRSRSTW